MSAYATTERIARLRNAAKRHIDQANQSARYEVYFAEQQKARRLEGQADQLETELQADMQGGAV